ncbi:MAG TPA: sporulation protein YunB [Clostridiales bacterium]|nr:sporulation protein YunB [Clostridiales bacterium]
MNYNPNFCYDNLNYEDVNAIKKSKKSLKNKKKHNKKRVLIKILIISLLIATVLFLFSHFYVYPQIVESNKSRIKNYSVDIINSAVNQTIINNDYDDLISIVKDDNGNITLLQINSKNVNKLNNDVMTLVQSKLAEKDVLNYSLPIGSFSGIPALNGVGPSVNLKILPVGSVSTQYNSQIASLSINQSYHKIYITINISICIFLPLYTQNIDVSSQILVAENLIVGKIPSTYLNTDNLTNALNLIP